MIGTTVSHYRITGLIGTGGMGQVYRAEDLTLPREVALKFLSRDLQVDAGYRERFLREAQAASALDHPNICTIYEIGEAPDGRTFIAMPCYDGRTVQSLVEDGPLAPHEAVTYALGAAQGLAKAHGKGILHRDVKPGNLFVTRDGVVKVLDFGVAKLASKSTITSPGAVVGTFAYMSPEQVRGEDVDPRTDVFSLGATLYEMVTGRSPFRGENQASTIHRILNVEPESPRRVQSGISADLERVILKALAKDRDDRFASMDEFAKYLGQVQRETETLVTRPLAPPVVEGTGGRSRRAVPVLAGILVVLLVALNWNWIRERLDRPGFGPRKGVVVLAGAGVFGGDTGDEPDDAAGTSQLHEAGLVCDLIGQVGWLADQDSDLWVVPPGRAQTMGATTVAQAADHLGVSAVVAVSVQDSETGPLADVQLLQAGNGRRLSGFLLPLDAEDWPDRLRDQLAGMLGTSPGETGAAPVGSARTADAAARRQYLTGLGYLGAKPDGYPDSARACFERALAADSLFSDAWVRRAEALYADRRNAPDSSWAREALASCGTALRLDPDDAQAFCRQGWIHKALGQSEAALGDFTRAVELSPRDPMNRRQVAWIYFETGRYEEAEAAFRAAAEAVPGYWGVHEDLGYFYQYLGRNQEALAPFERLVELVPAYPAAYNYLGAVYYALERWDAAIGMFERSFELEKSYYACANLGTLYYINGRFEDAVRMYEWAWEYDDSDYVTLGNLGSAYYWLPGQRDHAIGLLRQAAEMAERQREETPDDPELLSLLADYYSVDRGDTALACAKRALALAPEDPGVALRTARVYELLGERARALVLLGRALELGYSAKEIDHDPQFGELRKDPRYRLLIDEREPAGGDD